MKTVFVKHIKASTWMDEETKQRGVEKTMLIEKIIGADKILYDVEKFDKLLGVDGVRALIIMVRKRRIWNAHFFQLNFTLDNPYQILREKRMRENKRIWETVYEETQDNWNTFFHMVDDVNAFFAAPMNVMSEIPP